MSTPNYNINYDDERFKENEVQRDNAISQTQNTYNNMIEQSDQFYQNQIDASKEWADTQSKLQQEQTDFEIAQIEQQKAQTEKEYKKEQAAAYVDYQKQSNQYGVNAEQMASSGLGNTGYSESAKVSMYNTYQNRVATAKQSMVEADTQYNNAMTQAKLANNVAQAEIALQAYQQQAELVLQNFQNKNSLITERMNQILALESYYDSKHQNILDQMNTENALAEQVRQYNENLKEEKRQFDANLLWQQQKAGLSSGEESYGTIGEESNTIYDGAGTTNSETSNMYSDKRPSNISGYGTVEPHIYEGEQIALEIDGKEYDVYKTNDGTLWYWNGQKYVKLASNPLGNMGRDTSLITTNKSEEIYRPTKKTTKVDDTTIWDSLQKGLTIGSLNL